MCASNAILISGPMHAGVACLLALLGMYVGNDVGPIASSIQAQSKIPQENIVCVMQVENPIPFADPQTAKLTTGFLHAKYFHLLLLPWHLSADWSFACIPYLYSLSDPRNAATAALYAAVLWVVIASRPCTILSCILHGSQPAATVSNPGQQVDSSPATTDPLLLNTTSNASHCNGSRSTDAQTKQADKWRQAVWRMVIVVGLIIGPFVPAANIFFYVGTFIGERLLYLPSVGYCMMLAHFLIKLLGPGGLHSLHAIMLHLGISPPASTAGAFECWGAEPAMPAVPAGQREGVPSESPTSRAGGNTAVRGDTRLPYCKSTDQHMQQEEQQEQQVQQCKPSVHSSKATGRDASYSSRHVRGWIGLAFILVLLLGYSWRTVIRNRDWQDEETLFLAAQKVTSCASSLSHCFAASFNLSLSCSHALFFSRSPESQLNAESLTAASCCEKVV